MIAPLLLALLASGSQAATRPAAAPAAEAWLSYPEGPNLTTTVATHAFQLELSDGTRVGIVAAAALAEAGLPVSLETPGGVGQVRAWRVENSAGEHLQLGARARVTDGPFHALDWDPADASRAFQVGPLTEREGAALGLHLVRDGVATVLVGHHSMDDDELHYIELDEQLVEVSPLGSPVTDGDGRAVGVVVAEYEPGLWGIESLAALDEGVATWHELHNYTVSGFFYAGSLARASTRAILLHVLPDGTTRLRVVDWLEQKQVLERVYSAEEDVGWPVLSPDGRFAAVLYEDTLQWFDLERGEDRSLEIPFDEDSGYQLHLSGRSVWFETLALPLTRFDVDSGATHPAPEAFGRGWVLPSSAATEGPVFGTYDGIHLQVLGLPGQPPTLIHQEDYWVELGVACVDAGTRALYFSYDEGYGVAGIDLQTGELEFYWADYYGYLDDLTLSPSGDRLIAVESVGVADGELDEQGEVIDLPDLDQGESAFAGFVHEVEAGSGAEQRRSLAFDAFGLDVVTLESHTAALLSDGSIRVF